MAMEQAHTTVSKAEHELHSATERLARAAHQAVDTLSEYSGRAEERLREGGQTASERSRELIDQVKHYVEENPLAAIGIAAAVGFAMGTLMRGDHSADRRTSDPS